MTADIKIPYAMSAAQRLVHVNCAAKGEVYTCPDPTCGRPVIPRQGDVNRWHYAHQTWCASTGEGPVHEAAKFLVAQIVNDFLDGKLTKMPFLIKRHVWLWGACGRHQDNHYFVECQSCLEVLWSKLVRASVEFVLPCGRKPDVWCGLAIEIRYSHAVDQEKAGVYRQAGVTWIELDAGKVLDGEWALLAWETEEQRRAEQQRREEAKRLAQEEQDRLKAEEQRREQERQEYELRLQQIQAQREQQERERQQEQREREERWRRQAEELEQREREAEQRERERIAALTDTTSLEARARVEAEIELPDRVTLVAARTGRTDRGEVTFQEAATLRVIADCFPGANIVMQRRKEKP